MANAAYAYQVLTATVTSSVSTLTPTVKLGSVLLMNLSSSLNVFVSWDGSTPVAGFGNGAVMILANQILSLGLEEIAVVKAICSGSDTVNFQVVGWPSTSMARGSF